MASASSMYEVACPESKWLVTVDIASEEKAGG